MDTSIGELNGSCKRGAGGQKKFTGKREQVFISETTNEPFHTQGKFMPESCKAAEGKPFGFHGVRHLAASLLSAPNTPLVEIQKMFGHVALTTPEMYIKSLIEKQEAVQGLQSP